MKREPTVSLYLRIPLWLYEAIEKAAQDEETSMNLYCQGVLGEAFAQEEKMAKVTRH